MHFSKLSNVKPHFAFIIGAGRSGTTLVYKTLCLHAQVAWISNYLAKMPSVECLGLLNCITRFVPQAGLAAWFDKSGNAFLHGRSLLLRFVPTPVEGEAVYSRCGIPLHPKPNWRISRQQTDCLRRVFKRMAGLQRCKVLVSKRTANNRRIPQLLNAFPDAKFIHIIRDGRSVARSLLKVAWWPNMKLWWKDQSTPMQWQKKGGNQLELAARTWVAEMQEISAGIKLIPDSQIMELRYESLVANPIETLRSVARFIDLDNIQEWLQHVREINFYNGNKGRAIRDSIALNDADRYLLERIQADMLRRYGYRCETLEI